MCVLKLRGTLEHIASDIRIHNALRLMQNPATLRDRDNAKNWKNKKKWVPPANNPERDNILGKETIFQTTEEKKNARKKTRRNNYRNSQRIHQ